MVDFYTSLPPSNLRHLISVYLFLLIAGGHVLLPVIITTALLHRKLCWHPTLINLCVTWVVYSIVHCLYLYTGNGVQPRSQTVCTAQAAMIYGAGPMATVAVVGVATHTWTTMQNFEHHFAEKFPRWLCRFLANDITAVYGVRRVYNRCIDFDKTTERLCTTAQWTFLHVLRAFLSTDSSRVLCCDDGIGIML